jgi:hypothetical protein
MACRFASYILRKKKGKIFFRCSGWYRKRERKWIFDEASEFSSTTVLKFKSITENSQLRWL